ncbi:TonB-dependent receptor domain-containing protein [Gemmatimonas sp.]|jgi:outer membrane receptor for ferrienterochelin and colicins|uniref:TonB-dependent receptor n=1 Tax=Gemmatimonas sp. TaxID=1962908 RepID=UPI0037C075AA
MSDSRRTVMLRWMMPLGCALLLAVVSGGPARAQGGGTGSVQGTVLSKTDGAPVLSADVRVPRTGMRARTDERGTFRVAAAVGDSLIVRALGFAELRTVVQSRTPMVRLVALATVLPVFTTTMGQRVIRASESPRSVTVISREEIDAVAAVSANQLLRQLPGLQELPAPPSKTSISIRGFDDSRVLVLVDGEPVPGALIESRDIGRLSTIATERIEVTKGPSSVEFGSDALGGVINIVQAAPTPRLTVDALAREGGLGRQESSVGVSQTVGRFGYRLNGGWRQSDRVTGYNAIGSTFNRIYDVRTDFRYALTDQWALRLDMQGSQERQRFPVDAAFNGFIDNRGGQGFAEVRGPLFGGNIRARAFEQRFVYQYRQSRGLLPIKGSADSLEQRERQGRYLLSYTHVVGTHTIDVGAQRSHRTLIAPKKVTGDSADEQVTEVFARDSWTLGNLLMTAGARHTSSTLWGSSTNPSFGVAWQTSSSVRLRSNVARGFRAPGFKEIRYTFTNPAGGYTLTGNPELLPESSWSTSLGGTWAPSTRLSFDVEGYRNDVSGLVDWRYEGDNAAGFQTYRYVNVARARTQGVEANARVNAGATEVTVGYDFLRARDLNSGLPLSRRASHTARLRVAREWAVRQGLSTDASVRYTGNAPLVGIPSGAPITGPFSTESGVIGRQGALLSVDAQLRLAVTRELEVSGGVNNLLNQQPNLWTPAFARQFYVGLRWRWSVAP